MRYEIERWTDTGPSAEEYEMSGRARIVCWAICVIGSVVIWTAVFAWLLA